MRNPSLHKIFGRPLNSGLSNVLSGNARISECVQDSGRANLSLLIAGNIPPNPAELLSGDAMARVLAETTKQYDHVIVDGPPVLGLADAPLLSRAVESTILVIESGRTSAAQAKHAMRATDMATATNIAMARMRCRSVLRLRNCAISCQARRPEQSFDIMVFPLGGGRSISR
jgi:capsular exopolysaccharide synthesis family protein